VVTILDAMSDPQLFGRWFGHKSWGGWKAFLAGLFGLPMTEAQLAIYRQHTARTGAPSTPAREGYVVVGRRGGKSRIAALVAVWLACLRDWRDVLAPGEVGTLAVIAADRRQARVCLRYLRAFLEVPLLRQLVVAETKESVSLSNGVVIEVHTASFRSIRGYSLVGVIADEIAFWSTDEAGANPDTEVLNGLRPGLATTGGLLLAISSPYARRGELWRNYREHFGKDGDSVLVWQAPTQDMNPLIDPRVIAAAYEQDESAAAAEYGAEFRRDIESFVSREVVEAAVVPARRELPPMPNVRYRAFTDPSGGSQDSFTLVVAHREDKRVVVDVVRERKPPFNPSEVVAEFAELLRRYGCSTVRGDRYAAEWSASAFREHHISYAPALLNKSDLYSAFLPMLNSGQVELPDHPRLMAQLLGLERRTGRTGRDSIDHPPGGHDDVANAVAGACVAVGVGGKVTPISRQFGGVGFKAMGWD